MTEPSEHARRAAEKYSYAFHPGFSSDERLRLIQGIIDAATVELRKVLAHYAHADYLTTEQQAKAFAALHPEQKEKANE